LSKETDKGRDPFGRREVVLQESKESRHERKEEPILKKAQSRFDPATTKAKAKESASMHGEVR
jgi:hypothetical protein